MKYTVSKRFGPYSCAFRQWKAESHCRHLHGYGLTFIVTFEADELDERNWVIDFGGATMKAIKRYMEEFIDHVTIVARDDPARWLLFELQKFDAIKVNIRDLIGCEAFAQDLLEYIAYMAIPVDPAAQGRVSVVSVEVREHENNGVTVYA